jgi:hypothetical protein
MREQENARLHSFHKPHTQYFYLYFSSSFSNATYATYASSPSQPYGSLTRLATKEKEKEPASRGV